MSPEDSVNRSELLSGLRSLGLRRGDNVVVHCRLSSFGHIEGGAGTVIDALQRTITREGTIVMPTYSGKLIFFLEALALEAGINGEDGTGRGTVFEGTGEELGRALRRISRKNGIGFPFEDTEAIGSRITGENKRILNPHGWTIGWEGEVLCPSTPVLVSRWAPPLPEGDVRTWKMPASTGLVTDTFWRLPGVRRSHQYSGSFAAWGRLAEQILEGHDNSPGQVMEDHPLYRMKESGGRILLIGVDHRVNSTIHVAQWAAYRDSPRDLPPTWREFLEDFQEVEKPLEARGGQTKVEVGASTLRLADTAELFRVVSSLLGQKVKRELQGA